MLVGDDVNIIIAGGRHIVDRSLLFRLFDESRLLKQAACVFHGACRGVDVIGEEWAQGHGLVTISFEVTPADWRVIGRRAGPLRNAAMLAAFADGLVVVLDDKCKGSWDMKRQADKDLLPVEVFNLSTWKISRARLIT